MTKNNNKLHNYSSTINLPKNKFPMKGNLPITELITLNKWNKEKYYLKFLKHKNKNKNFYLHDGPPYANGHIHIGHALNKILKDIIIKVKKITQYNILYIPGWDCHGLPIELIIQNKYKQYNFKDIKYIDILHKKCINFVKKQIDTQKKEFIRLGIITDWKNCYLTNNNITISNTIKIFQKIFTLNYIEYKNKPIYWCINCLSSLSEAEVQYSIKNSLSTYISFTLHKKKKFLIKNNLFNKKLWKYEINLIIWTTTIWTIPGNTAITLNPNLYYVMYYLHKKIIIIALNQQQNFFNKIQTKSKFINIIIGKQFNKCTVLHPISNITIPIILDKNIDKNTGTGIVHIAPAHGEYDSILSFKHNLKNISVINNFGTFISYKFIPNIKNTNIQLAESIISKKLYQLKKIIYQENIKHNYPHCWRHKTPIIFKSTPQLFINLTKNNIKQKIIDNLKYIKWIPKWGYKKMKDMITKRPDWCITRQRFWGTPIPLFIHKHTNMPHPNSNEILNKIIKKIKIYGPLYWYHVNSKKLLKTEYKNYKKIIDTLDVWFDSGSTWYTTPQLQKKNITSDLYLEGNDQYRGWFMSSLIIHTIIHNSPPCKKIISHGFTVDQYGKKMSKSLQNTISPQKIINKYGADTLRLWVASTNYTHETHLSNEIILRTTDTYRKIRNTIKFLVSNLDDFNIDTHYILPEKMLSIDRWIIHVTNIIQKKIIFLYKTYQFYKIIKLITYFCTRKLSNLYFDIIKDRKYTIKKNTLPYNSALTTIWILLETLIKWLYPILPFTTEEIWKYIPRNKKTLICDETWCQHLFYLKNTEKITLSTWNKLYIIKKEFNIIIENLRNKKIISNSLETNIVLYINKKFYKTIQLFKKEIKYYFLTSKIKLKIFPKNINIVKQFKIICTKNKGIKCLRCWHYTKKITNYTQLPNICNRCIKNILGTGEIRLYI